MAVVTTLIDVLAAGVVLVPLVGAIVLLVFYASGPNPAGARFDRAGTPQDGEYAGQPQA